MRGQEYNPILDDTPLSVFETIIQQARCSDASRVIPLHQGKTAFTTPVPLRDWTAEEFSYPPYHDGPTSGTDVLRDAIRDKLQSQYNQDVACERITVTCGITHALSIVFHSVLRPGDEVIVLSPQWLFTNGLIRAAGGVPVEVPTFPVTAGAALPALTARIKGFLTPRTRAIYFNSPNNPTGYCLAPRDLSALASVARENGLWLVADNAYEFYDYTRHGFTDIASIDGAEPITFAAYSFSKSYGLTGYRIGYLVSPPAMAERTAKHGLYSVYSVPTCCQFVALAALRSGPAAVQRNAAFVKQARDLTMQTLRVPATTAQGGFYTLLDLSAWPAGVDDFIQRCISRGVSLAPGWPFGRHCSGFARLCYSVVGHADLAEGIRIINGVYDAVGNAPQKGVSSASLALKHPCTTEHLS